LKPQKNQKRQVKMQASVSDVKKTQDLVTEFLGKLGVSAKAHVFAVEEYIKIEIDGKDAPILIGREGDNLQALRHVLSIMLRNQVADDVVVMVDVADYLARKEQRLIEMAKKAAKKFDETKDPQHLPPMNAYERRLAHSWLSDNGYDSESAGEGYERHIVVKK
jgi:spoIIIJ-associated protein